MILRRLRDLARDRRGNVAIIFALSIIPILILIGLSVDLGNATRIRLDLQDATDSASLAVARNGLTMTDAQIPVAAASFMSSNYRNTSVPYTVTKITFDRTAVVATLDTKASVPTTFLGLMGVKTIPITAHSVSKGLGFEIALVLDTSGSMGDPAGSGGTKIAALKAAATSLFDTLFGTQTTSSRFSIGIVPFAASVNVGTGFANAAWMDTSSPPKNPYHAEDFDASVNRFSLFSGTNGMKGVSWGGCIMTRPAPYDVDDTTPSTSNGSTLFVPWFAPDEPDGDNFKSSGSGKYDYRLGTYYNNYLNDEGGGCTGNDILVKATDAVKQARTCKYKGVTPTTSGGLGPNYLCNSQPITALSNSRSTLNAAITALSANGNTNIFEGMMWGWRVLSPTEPFTQGKAYGAPNNRKVIILMTDGENNFNAESNYNDSDYFSFGFARLAHAGAATNNNTTLTSYLNAKTLTACTNAKAKGIIVYTIAFGSGAAASQSLLQSCATDPSYFYAPQNSSDLQPVFLKIAQSINSLRIAE